MIQLDASLHGWLEGREPFALIGGIDDATNRVWADLTTQGLLMDNTRSKHSVERKYVNDLSSE